jgi:hypothetical protein
VHGATDAVWTKTVRDSLTTFARPDHTQRAAPGLEQVNEPVCAGELARLRLGMLQVPLALHVDLKEPAAVKPVLQLATQLPPGKTTPRQPQLAYAGSTKRSGGLTHPAADKVTKL